MDDKDVLRVTEDINQLEKRLDSVSLNNEGSQPLVLHRDKNSRIQKSVEGRRLKNDQISRASCQAENRFNRDVSKNTTSNNLPWRRRVIKDDKNNSSCGPENIGSRSDAWSKFSSNSRSSSRGHHTYNENKKTDWRDNSFKTKGKPADENKNKFGFFDKRCKRNGPDVSNQRKPIGYEYLKALSGKQPLEMISEILKPEADINFILNRKELPTDWMFLITQTLRKLCECDFKINRIEILQFFCESPLMNHVSNYLGEIGMEENTDIIQSLNFFISDLVVFYSAVIDTMPTVAVNKNFDKFLKKTKIGIDQIETYLNAEIEKTILEKLESLEEVLENETNIREKKMEKPRRNYLDFMGDLSPPDDFRELNLYPTHEDLNRQEFGFVRPNKIKGAYDDVDHYLDVQFRLIREDFIDPLRRGLKQYKDAIASQCKPKYKYENVRFYPNTLIEGMERTARGPAAYVVNFNKNNRFNKIKWEYNKWFMYGSLLLFTRDNFNSYFFATVSNRDLPRLKKGRILVTLIENKPLDHKMFNQPFLMAESETYFEPYGLVMKALKNFNEYDFPMKQFIVNGDTVTDLPRYIQERANVSNFFVYSNCVDLSRDDSWPHHSTIGFDEYQFNAFKTALTSNFTVIQGPPGTGKTYLGLKIVEVILRNVESGIRIYNDQDRAITPILIVCYTNHALDQFLEGILKFNSNIVRIGGQSKSESLEKFNLRGRQNFSSLRSEARILYPTFNRCRRDIKDISYRINLKNREKSRIENPIGILSYDSLTHVMSADFQRILNDQKTFLFWLFNNDPYMTQNILRIISPDHSAKNSYIDPMEFVKTLKVDNKIHGMEEDEITNAADVLVDEDDVFDPQDVNIRDMSVYYCVTMREICFSLEQTRQELETLDSKLFLDYCDYYNYNYYLEETLRITQVQYQILNRYLRNNEIDSSSKNSIPNRNLWEMPIDQRWSIYWTLVSRLRDYFVNQLKQLEAEYLYKCQQYEELKQLEDFHIVKHSSVVGMTTTCAARLQLFLKSLNPKIVIVEEAAEVLESHIVVSLNRNCQHVILIGDHKQLKPSSAVYELSRKYNINVSLFERMINNNMYCPQLQVQHRMREEISNLLVPSIYPKLQNHPSVLEYPSVKGIVKNLFFVEHSVFEEAVEDSSSRKNKFEAEFIIQLCGYLLFQGYKPDQITILTTYTGQMYLLKEMKGGYKIMANVKVVVVDKYQGEENDIILLSLVRSNEERRIGFLSIENRVCVALSRAKIGLYIIGNMDILSDSPLWKNMKEELIKQKAIGSKMTLYCDKHDVYTQVSCESDFKNVSLGGCNRVCHDELDCGHKCQLLCHKIEMACREKCLKQCVENHPCPKYCYEECGLCIVLVERNLPCGHTVTLTCHTDYQIHLCQVEVSVVLEPCGHEVEKKCFEAKEYVQCTFPCEHLLQCGHLCVKKCHKKLNPNNHSMMYQCRRPCEKINPGCVKEHKCRKLCFEYCGKCEVPVDVTLACGHSIKLPCSVDPGLEKCHFLVDVTLVCGHSMKLPCSVDPNLEKCQFPVDVTLVCGHSMKLPCSVDPSLEKCQVPVDVTLACGHLIRLPCSVDLDKIKCYMPCKKVCQECKTPCPQKCFEDCKPCSNKVTKRMPNCGHRKKMACWADPAKIKCYESCYKKCSECNRTCPKKCYEDCQPCQKKVKKRIPICGHEQEIECSVVPERKLCKKKCNRIGPCGHECKSLCGEPCSIDQCMVVVKSTCVQALCGHGYADVQCWRRNEAVNAEELLPNCTEPCVGLLKCGDLCSGTCGSCWQGRFHQTCQEKCENVFVCGHSCSYPCGKACPPCAEKCQNSCRHSKCTKNCGELCVPCEKKCQWNCAHYKCTKKCGDICDRPPCYEPCPKKLPCKHACIGFCGEPCPKKCRICNKREITKIIFGNEDEDDARFVLLQDCGHIVESEAMERYLSNVEKGKIVMKFCPFCEKPISKTLRYMNHVKKFYQDIQQVKTKIYGDKLQMLTFQIDLRTKVNDLDLSNDFLKKAELVFIENTVVWFRRLLKDGVKLSKLSRQALKVMHFFTSVFLSIISRLDDVKQCVENEKIAIFGNLQLLLKLLNPVVLQIKQINTQLVEDTVRELNRYHLLVDYSVYLNEPEYQSNRELPNVMDISGEIVDILYGWKCFDQELETRIGELFEKLQNEINSGQSVSQEAKRMVHATLMKDFFYEMNNRGYWFTCTKGHYYITECDGTLEEGGCPECDRNIGEEK